MFNFKPYFFEIVQNTNKEIKKIWDNSKKYPAISLFSKKQQNGKGRGKKIWLSTCGDLTCSFLISKKLQVTNVGRISITAGLSVYEGLQNVYPNIPFKIKWPNDIYLNKKKLGGILIESSINKYSVEYFIIGIGINIVTSPKQLTYETIKISDFSKIIDPKLIFFSLEKSISTNFKLLFNKKFNFIKHRWLKKSINYGKNITIKKDNKVIHGKFLSLDDYGSIIMENNEKKKVTITQGELSSE